MIQIQRLKADCEKNGIVLNDIQAGKLDRFSQILTQWNEKINLTAITDPEEIVDKHLIDSLLASKSIEMSHGMSLIDVGTGAGFPSTPLAVLFDSLKVVQLDSLNKRVNFLKEVADKLQLENVKAIHSRAEDAGKNKEYREKFDIATARAVANLLKLSEYCLPFVKVGGHFLAMKGPDVDAELEEAKPAIKELGGKTVDVKSFILPDNSERTIIVVKKISQTPTKYPRPSAKISKNPIISK